MRHFPIFLDLRGAPVLIVGGGEIAERKLTLLRSAGADITVVAPEALPAIAAFASADCAGSRAASSGGCPRHAPRHRGNDRSRSQRRGRRGRARGERARQRRRRCDALDIHRAGDRGSLAARGRDQQRWRGAGPRDAAARAHRGTAGRVLGPACRVRRPLARPDSRCHAGSRHSQALLRLAARRTRRVGRTGRSRTVEADQWMEEQLADRPGEQHRAK